MSDRTNTAAWACIVCAQVTANSDYARWFSWVWIGMAALFIIMDRRSK